MSVEEQFAFADALKLDCQPLIDKLPVEPVDAAIRKEMVRPLWVAWGQVARKFLPCYWIVRLFADGRITQAPQAIITDVRYVNEVRAIEHQGGLVVRILRPGYGAANEEERLSFQMIESTYPDMPYVVNDSTPVRLGEKILEWLPVATKEILGGKVVKS